MSQRRLGAIVAAIALVCIAGCSSGGSSSGPPSSSGGGSGSGGSIGSSSGSNGGSSSGTGSSDSGGSGTDSCGIAYETQACASCNSQYCCDEEQACAADEACGILLKCLVACGADTTCVDACGSAVPTPALDELASTLNCSSAHCASACSVATDAGASCGSTPTLHEDTAGSIYCDSQLTCSGKTQCCLGGAIGGGQYAADSCVALGGSCTNGGQPDAGGSPGIPIACAQVADCRANGVAGAVSCCLQSATTPANPPGCSYPRATLGSAIVCETSACAEGETAICSSQADCPAGKTCTPGKWKTMQLGFCL